MNINKKWLKDENDNFIAPRTLTSAIQDENGNSFQEYADNMIIMDSDGIINVPTDLTSNITNKDIQNIVSDVYNNTKTYSVGDYCIYNNRIYKCNTDITTAEEFNASHWTATSIDNEISLLNNNYTNLVSVINKKYDKVYGGTNMSSNVPYSYKVTTFVSSYIIFVGNYQNASMFFIRAESATKAFIFKFNSDGSTADFTCTYANSIITITSNSVAAAQVSIMRL